MFTIRFIKHGGRGHTAYSCAKYSTVLETDHTEVCMTTADGEQVFEQIGPTEPYDIAYVTNEAGRTIDKITV